MMRVPQRQATRGFCMAEPAARRAVRLELTAISKRYPGVLAHDNVSLTVAPGEIHGLIGENGAGDRARHYGGVRHFAVHRAATVA